MCTFIYIYIVSIYNMSILNMYQQKKKENGLGQTTSRHILCFICLDLKWNCIRTKNCLTSPADGPSFLSDLHYKRVSFLFVESYWKNISPKVNPLRLFETPHHKVLLCRWKKTFLWYFSCPFEPLLIILLTVTSFWGGWKCQHFGASKRTFHYIPQGKTSGSWDLSFGAAECPRRTIRQ